MQRLIRHEWMHAYEIGRGNPRLPPHSRDTQIFLACLCRPRRLASAVFKMHPPLSILLRLGLCLFSSPQDIDLNSRSMLRGFICAKLPFPFVPCAHLLRSHLRPHLAPSACHQPRMVLSKHCLNFVMRIKSLNSWELTSPA